MKKKKHLHVLFNYAMQARPRYIFTQTDADGEIVEQRMLSRKPVGWFDSVSECGCGASSERHLAYCTNTETIHGKHYA